MAGKDLWIKVKVDDKELEALGKKTKKTIEGSVEKGFKSGSSKGMSGPGGMGQQMGRGGMAGSVAAGQRFQQLRQAAVQSGGQAARDIYGAISNTGLRVQAEKSAAMAAAQSGGAALKGTPFEGIADIASEAGQAAIEKRFERPMAIAQGSQAKMKAYVARLQSQGVNPDQQQLNQIAQKFAAWENQAYKNSIMANKAVNSVKINGLMTNQQLENMQEANIRAKKAVQNKGGGKPVAKNEE